MEGRVALTDRSASSSSGNTPSDQWEFQALFTDDIQRCYATMTRMSMTTFWRYFAHYLHVWHQCVPACITASLTQRFSPHKCSQVVGALPLHPCGVGLPALVCWECPQSNWIV